MQRTAGNPSSLSISSKLPQVGTTIFTVMSRMAAEHGAINLSQGFPDFPPSDELINLVTQAMKNGHNQYAPMPGVMALREQIAIKTEQLYGYAPHPEHEITITSGATEALFAAITSVIREGDEAIVLEPCYDSYIPAIELNGGKVVRVPLENETYRIPWETLKKRMNSRTKLILINTPHNPSGSILTKEDVCQLATLVKGTDIFIISDEVYEHIIFDGEPHYSVLHESELRGRSFVISSFGKTYHTTGWKLGYCIAPASLTKEFRKVHQYLTFSSFTPAQYALADYLKTPAHYLEVAQFYQQRRDTFLSLMKQTRFRMLTSKGSYFALASFGHLSDEKDTDYTTRLTKEYGVAAVPVSAFYKDNSDNHVIRFCFAKKDQTLEQAVERLVKC